ncbi:MAG TPA: KH domain-containing protein, partial [Gammaproteobacteria bacterium]|nr:KH domain-containing protein [Gammaproteobacteria bacterium]
FKIEEKLISISAIIWVEREGQKPIVIGKNGERLKKIGTQARKEIEKLLGNKVFLRLWVKVKDDWTDDERALGSLGYE